MKRVLLLSLSAVVLLSSFLFAFTSCNTTDDTEKPIDTPTATSTPKEESTVFSLQNLPDQVQNYTLIRSSKANNTIVQAYLQVRDAILARTGIMPNMSDDYLKSGETADSETYEILVGSTTRPESDEALNSIKNGNYTIKQVGNKICIIGKDDAATQQAVVEFCSVFFGYRIAEKTFHNVADYGAVGDNATDDTNAFKRAIAAAEKDGLPVYVPYGNYIVSDTLELNSVTLYGYISGAWTADDCDLPIITQTNAKKPLFDVISGSVAGLHIEVKGVNADTADAAETIRIIDTGGRVSNITIRNPYIGISTAYGEDFPGNPGRCFIENIFIVQAWNTGVRVYGTYDVATLCNIEVWNNNISHSCPTAFVFGHNDDLRAVNLFAFNAAVGFLYEETPTGDGDAMGSCWGSFTNCSVDYTSIGIRVGAGSHHLTFVGGTYWTHHRALEVTAETERALVTASGCEMKSNGSETLTISGGSMVTVTGCNVDRSMSGMTNPCVSISGSAAITLNGNTFNCRGINVSFSPAFSGAAAVVGNTLRSNGSQVFRGETGTKGTVVCEANAILKNYDMDN